MFAQIEQVKTLISECQNQQLRFILYAGIHAGLRKAEIAAAKWGWFDFERMTINVTRDEFFDTKDGEDRTIPLTIEFAAFLSTYPHPNACMIPFRASLTRKEINFQFSEVVLKFFFEVQQRSDLSSHSYGGYEIDDRSGPQKQDPAYLQ